VLLTEHCSADEVTEVAGKAAYAAAGFPDVNVKVLARACNNRAQAIISD